MSIRGGNCPPWRETIPAHYQWSNAYGHGRVVRTEPERPDLTRPMEWLEIVQGERVVMRTLRPLSRLYGVLQRGEKVYRAKRRDKYASIHSVERTLVYGALT